MFSTDVKDSLYSLTRAGKDKLDECRERLKSKLARNSRIELSLHTFNQFLYTLYITIKTLHTIQLNTSKLEVATRGEPKPVQAVRAELSSQPAGRGCPALTAAPHRWHTDWPW